MVWECLIFSGQWKDFCKPVIFSVIVFFVFSPSEPTLRNPPTSLPLSAKDRIVVNLFMIWEEMGEQNFEII